MFVIRDPFDSRASFPAIAEAAVDTLRVPDDVLLGEIVDQSPIWDTPRNMIIEFNGGNACVIVQADTRSTRATRRSLEKTAAILNRHVLSVYVPVELMTRIRAVGDQEKGG